MEREERLRRRRERDRARRAAETPEEADARRARRRLYDAARRRNLTSEERTAMNSLRTDRRRQLNNDFNNPSQIDYELRNCSIDDELITNKIKQFYTKLFAIESGRCTICLERFPTVKTDNSSVCTRCRADTKIPKAYSIGNNMDPGPLPPELSVSKLHSL